MTAVTNIRAGGLYERRNLFVDLSIRPWLLNG